MNKSHMNKILE